MESMLKRSEAKSTLGGVEIGVESAAFLADSFCAGDDSGFWITCWGFGGPAYSQIRCQHHNFKAGSANIILKEVADQLEILGNIWISISSTYF